MRRVGAWLELARVPVQIRPLSVTREVGVFERARLLVNPIRVMRSHLIPGKAPPSLDWQKSAAI